MKVTITLDNVEEYVNLTENPDAAGGGWMVWNGWLDDDGDAVSLLEVLGEANRSEVEAEIATHTNV